MYLKAFAQTGCVNTWSKAAGFKDDNWICLWLWVDESHGPLLFWDNLSFCWISEPKCNCWQNFSPILLWWAEDKSKWVMADHGLRRWTVWRTSQGMSIFTSKEVFLWLPWANSLWCWENRLGTAGPHFGSVATTTLYIRLWCHLIPWRAVLSQHRCLTLRLHAVSTSVCLCSSDYMECWLYSFGSLDSRITEHGNSQVTGSQDLIKPSLYLLSSELWFTRGKSYLIGK